MKREVVDRKKRIAELEALFDGADDRERKLVENLIVEAVFLEEEMEALKTKPFLNVHPKNPTLVRTSPAAKLYKECCSNYANITRILLNVLRKTDTSAQDELLKKLEEFA